MRKTVGRPKGSLGVSERRIRKVMNEVINADMYETVILSIYDMATTGNSSRVKIDAAKFIVERIEGSLPQVVNNNVMSNTINDLLNESTNEE